MQGHPVAISYNCFFEFSEFAEVFMNEAGKKKSIEFYQSPKE